MTKLETKVNRVAFNLFYHFFPKEATEWLNMILETARIADEEMEWEPDIS